MRLAITLTVVFVFGLQAASARAAAGEPAYARSISWGGRYHTDREALASWLAARGASYEVWAERHPLAAARLEGRTRRAATTVRAPDSSPALGRALPLALALAGLAALALAWLLAVPAVSYRLGFSGVIDWRVDIGLFGLVLIAAAAVVYALR